MSFLPNYTTFNITIVFLLILLVLSIVGLLLVIYRFLTKWLTFLQRKNISGADKIKQDAYKEATEMLDEAHHKALKIVSDATTAAQSSLASMENLSTESKELVSSGLDALVRNQEEALKKASADLLTFYKQTLAKQKDESIRNLEAASHGISEELKHEVEDFKEILHKETVETQKEVEAKIQQEYAKIEKELVTYKATQIKNIDETIYDILHDVSTRVLGEALSMEDQQELVIKALSEAKENNVFSHS